MNFTIFDVSFKRKKDVLFCLGYKSEIAQTQIDKQYKGFENLIKNRLGLENVNDIKNKLQELRDQYYNDSVKTIDPTVKQVMKAMYKLLSNTQKEAIIAAVSISSDKTTEEIKEAVNDFLNN